MHIIVTRRLTLRPPLDVDAEFIFEHFRNEAMTRNLGRPPHPYELQHAQEFVARDHGGKDACTFTIHRERLIGCIGVERREGKEHPMLGYWLGQPFWGHGYASEAARAVLAYAFRKFRTDTIIADCIADNTASLKVLEKLGFQQTGNGSLYQAVRGEDVPTVKTQLSRDAFEHRFGSLEENAAA